MFFPEAFHISHGWEDEREIIKLLTDLVINKEISGIFLQVNYQELSISYLTTKFLSDNN